MNILVTCHRPPGAPKSVKNPLGAPHNNVFFVNKNLTRKNLKKANNTTNTHVIFYLDVEPGVPENTPNFFSSWSSVPDGTLDIIWAHNCPVLEPFTTYEIPLWSLGDGRRFTEHAGDTTISMWSDLLKNGERILKEGGHIIIPLPSGEDNVKGNLEVALIVRILNLEIFPDYLYSVDVIIPFSKKHKTYLNNLFIAGKDDMNHNIKKYKLLVITKEKLEEENE